MEPKPEPIRFKDKKFLKVLETLGFNIETRVSWDEKTDKYYEVVTAMKWIGGYTIIVHCVREGEEDVCHITAQPTTAPTIYTKVEAAPKLLENMLVKIQDEVKDYNRVFFEEYVCKSN
jgi:hypothetical protein